MYYDQVEFIPEMQRQFNIHKYNKVYKLVYQNIHRIIDYTINEKKD